MRTLAIGDIHGCLTALDTLLETLQPRADDLLITLGDYVDRGPDSRGVLDRLIELGQRCRHVAIRGNHDLMMLSARTDLAACEDWLECGGRKTMESYLVEPNWSLLPSAVPEAHWRFLEHTCVPYYETERHFFVHANVYADLPLDLQPDYMLYWEKLSPSQSRPHESGKTMICGHTQQRSGKPLNLGHAICIDTWAYGDGWLTCLDVETGMYWRANQRGETRLRWLEEPD